MATDLIQHKQISANNTATKISSTKRKKSRDNNAYDRSKHGSAASKQL